MMYHVILLIMTLFIIGNNAEKCTTDSDCLLFKDQYCDFIIPSCKPCSELCDKKMNTSDKCKSRQTCKELWPESIDEKRIKFIKTIIGSFIGAFFAIVILIIIIICAWKLFRNSGNAPIQVSNNYDMVPTIVAEKMPFLENDDKILTVENTNNRNECTRMNGHFKQIPRENIMMRNRHASWA